MRGGKKSSSKIAMPVRRKSHAVGSISRLGSQDCPPKQRKIAKSLATGETTKAAARKHHVSPGRISQIRRELMSRWFEFIGKEERAVTAAIA